MMLTFVTILCLLGFGMGMMVVGMMVQKEMDKELQTIRNQQMH